VRHSRHAQVTHTSSRRARVGAISGAKVDGSARFLEQ
jgi:hypothetical protein